MSHYPSFLFILSPTFFFFYPLFALITPSLNYNIEHAFWALPFFFFCFGGWSTTLMAWSKTAFTFCKRQSTVTLGTRGTNDDLTEREQVLIQRQYRCIPAGFLNCTQCKQELRSASPIPLPGEMKIWWKHSITYRRIYQEEAERIHITMAWL